MFCLLIKIRKTRMQTLHPCFLKNFYSNVSCLKPTHVLVGNILTLFCTPLTYFLIVLTPRKSKAFPTCMAEYFFRYVFQLSINSLVVCSEYSIIKELLLSNDKISSISLCAGAGTTFNQPLQYIFLKKVCHYSPQQDTYKTH